MLMNRNDVPPPVERRRSGLRLRLLLAAALLWGLPTLACGSFTSRPAPTPTPLSPAPSADNSPAPLQTPIPLAATETPLPIVPTATFTATPLPGTALSIGQPARVVAPNGANLRAEASTTATLVRYLPARLKVTLLDGPTEAEGYRWWKLDDGEGNVGWAVENDGETDLLSPQMGEPEPVDRSPRVGERVRVTMANNGQLSIRETPGTDSNLVTRVDPGQEFTVTGGPQDVGGYTWFQIRSDNGEIEGWAAESDGTERWLSPLE